MGRLWKCLREASLLLYKNAKLFSLLSLIVIFPLSIVQVSFPLLLQSLLGSLKSVVALAGSTSVVDPAVVGPGLAAQAFGLYIASVLISLLWVIRESSVFHTVNLCYSSSGKKIPLRDALNFVPKVWERVFYILVWNTLIQIAVLTVLTVLGTSGYLLQGKLAAILVVGLFLLGSIPMAVSLVMAVGLGSVVTVVEELHGIAAIRAGDILLSGNKWLGLALTILPVVPCNIFLQGVLPNLVLPVGGNIVKLLGVCAVTVVVNTFVQLVVDVLQGVFYFACKAYHEEEPSGEYSALAGDEESGGKWELPVSS